MLRGARRKRGREKKIKGPAIVVDLGRNGIMHQKQRAAMLSWTQKGAQNWVSLTVGGPVGQSCNPEEGVKKKIYGRIRTDVTLFQEEMGRTRDDFPGSRAEMRPVCPGKTGTRGGRLRKEIDTGVVVELGDRTRTRRNRSRGEKGKKGENVKSKWRWVVKWPINLLSRFPVFHPVVVCSVQSGVQPERCGVCN